jgi:predicted nucleotidyltransferase
MQIDEKLKAHIARICKTNRIRIMAVFGSSLQRTGRDIDLALYPHWGVGPEVIDKLRLIAELETLLGREVDIIVVNPGTSTTLLFEICRNSLLLYEDQAGSFENERSIAFRKYADTLKFRRMRERTVASFVEELDVVT